MTPRTDEAVAAEGTTFFAGVFGMAVAAEGTTFFAGVFGMAVAAEGTTSFAGVFGMAVAAERTTFFAGVLRCFASTLDSNGLVLEHPTIVFMVSNRVIMSG